MTVSLKHKFTSAQPDGGDASLVRPSNWNDEHDLVIDTAKIVGRTTAGTGSAEEIAVSAELTLASGTLGVASSIGGKKLTGPTIVDVNSASTALRVTQIGSGNAFVVEDSANPDASPFVIDTTGIVGIGETTPGSYVSAGMVIKSSVAFCPTISIWNTTNDGSFTQINTRKDRSGAIVQNGDTIFSLRSTGYDGSAYRPLGDISFNVDGVPGTNDMPGRITFSTTADGAASATEHMRITSAGRVGIGTSAPATKLDVWSSGLIARFNSTTTSSYIRCDDSSGNLGLFGIIGGTAWVGSASSTPLLFVTNIAEKMRLDASGNLGIATSTPTQKLDVNDDSVRVRTAKTPASATATGTQGQIAWDSDYVYVCTATNTWKRTAITTW